MIEQEQRLIDVTTPLGKDVLILQSFRGTEELSQLFTYHLEMLSDNDAISAADIVGKNVTFSVRLEEGGRQVFNGFVRRFIGGGLHTRELRRYQAEVVPWVWFLTRSSDCRIFQNLTAPDIIEQVFQELGFTDFDMDLQGEHRERIYCVQYRESAFQFVSRLMEDEGIFYWFTHAEGKHILHMADHAGAYKNCPENELEYFPGSRTSDVISTWEHRYEFRSGRYCQTDYNFETPNTRLETSTDTLVSLPNITNYELYDYWGGYKVKGDGEALTKLRMEEEETPHDMVCCASGYRTLFPSGKFKVTRHESPSEEGSGFTITSVSHAATDDSQLSGAASISDYQNSFTCIPDTVVFRPTRSTPKPEIKGPQTAVVVGPAGEEIYPDEHGRVKVQFHWDRLGKNDENSSCWIRVSHPWAGKGWGAVAIPRIGQEVIVDFLEGDIDSPIITGRVYNGIQTPPYPLPAQKVLSGYKSDSSKGGGGYNEYVMDDTKGNELIREHGQFDKDSTIEHDLREHVFNDRSRDVTNNETVSIGVNRDKTVGNDQSEAIGKNKTITVGVNHTEIIGANMTLGVGNNTAESVGVNKAETIGALKALTIGAAYQVSVGTAMNETIGGLKAEQIGAAKSVTVGGSSSENITADKSVDAGGNISDSAGKDVVVSAGKDYMVKGGQNGVIDIADQLTIKCGSASITLKKNGDIIINGKDINTKGSGNIVMKAKKILEN